VRVSHFFGNICSFKIKPFKNGKFAGFLVSDFTGM